MKVKLTMTESNLAMRFYDEACRYQPETFKQITHRVLDKSDFTKKHSKAFVAECRTCFDLARVKP